VAISSNFRPDLLAKALRLFIIIPVLFTFFLSQIRISSTTATSKELSQDSHLQHQAAPFFFFASDYNSETERNGNKVSRG
jgi:hypothetical protein